MIFQEARVGFPDFDTWSAWASKCRWLRNEEQIASVVSEIRALGLNDPIDGPKKPQEINIGGTNWRETIGCDGINSRSRAVLLDLRNSTPPTAKVYASEAITPMARKLASMFSNFIGSEYMPTEDGRRKRPRVQHQDIQALSFADRSFDVYVSCEVFEHIPSVHRALAEARRILVPGGRLIATFPFAYGRQESIHKAIVDASGQTRILIEPPEYHGNPVLPNEGSLVYTIPGWEIIDWARAAGFSAAEMIFHASRHHGIVGAEIAGIFVFHAVA